jgi:predicted Rossmann fold nucleotide-binding protein DprA/Smf involved in DNA uptake
MTADELCAGTGMEIRDMNTLLTVMELRGRVEAGAGGVFRISK